MYICVLRTQADSLGAGGDMTRRAQTPGSQSAPVDRVSFSSFPMFSSSSSIIRVTLDVYLSCILSSQIALDCYQLCSLPNINTPPPPHSIMLVLCHSTSFCSNSHFRRIYQSQWNKGRRWNNVRILSYFPLLTS